MPRSFYTTFCAAFAAAFLALLPAGWALHGRLAVRQRLSGWPQGWTAPGVRGPEQAKFDGVFWCPQYGSAFRVLEDPGLFASLFPGYEALRGDRWFWRRYFQADFDQAVFSPELMTVAPAAQLFTSWLGNLQLFDKAGADVALFGVSDTFVSLSPGLLERELPGKKIVQLAKGNLYPETLAWALRNWPTRRRAALSIWGYSVHYGRRTTENDLLQQAIRSSFRKWSMDGFWESFGFDRHFRPIPWTLIAGPSLEATIDDSHPAGPARLPDDLARQPRQLADYLSAHQAPLFAVDVGPSACDFSRQSRDLDDALRQMLRFSDKVLLFLPPVSPLIERQLPPCYLDGVRAMLRAEAGPRVAVELSGWKDYGLDYPDYLYPTETLGVSTLDGIHFNDAGAAKVSALIGRRAAALLAVPELSSRP